MSIFPIWTGIKKVVEIKPLYSRIAKTKGGCAALMSHSQPKIWQKIQKIGGDYHSLLESMDIQRANRERGTLMIPFDWTQIGLVCKKSNIGILVSF